MKNTHFPIITKSHLKLPIYLINSGIYFEETELTRPNGYPAYQWIQCISGEGLFYYDHKEYTIQPGKGIFIYPDVFHKYWAVKKPWITHWIGFNGYSLHSLLHQIGIHKTGVYTIKHSHLLEEKLVQCFNLSTSNDIYTNVETSAFLFQFLVDIVKNTMRIDQASIFNQHNKLQPVIDYIDSNYEKLLTIDALAELIEVTPQYLCQLFNKLLQKRPFEYIHQVRINKSKEFILQNPYLSIGKISRQVGFENASYFGALFKKMEGLTPGQFKKLYSHD